MSQTHEITLRHQGGRVIELDAVRAIAVISMVIGHVANYSFMWRVSHFAYYVWDGAQLFMLVSGLVVGIVQHKNHARHGMKFVAGKLAKRALLLYVVQVILVALAMIAYFKIPNDFTAQFKPVYPQNLTEALLQNFMLAVNPIYVNFLSSYVIILLIAIPAVWMLAKNQWKLLLALGVVFLIAGWIWPAAFTPPIGPRIEPMFNTATWGFLFGTGLIVGWHWREWHIPKVLLNKTVTVIAFALWLLLLVVAVFDAVRPHVLEPINWFFDKDAMTPGRLISSWVFFIVLWWVVQEIHRTNWGWRVINPMAVLGSRALDSVIIMTVAAIAIPTVLHIRSESRGAQVLALIVIGICWAWAYWRDRPKRA